MQNQVKPLVTFRLFWVLVLIFGCSGLSLVQGQDSQLKAPDTLRRQVSFQVDEPTWAMNGVYTAELEWGTRLLPKMIGSVMWIPLKDALQTLGGEWILDGTQNTVTLRFQGREMRIKLGQQQAYLNGQPVKLPGVPEMIPNDPCSAVLYLPVASVMESLGCQVEWDSLKKRQLVTAYVSPEWSGPELGGPVTVRTLLNQKNDWLSTNEADQVLAFVIAYQNPDGGWRKLNGNTSLLKPLAKMPLYATYSTVDNDSTIPQLRFLARMVSVGKSSALEPFYRGVDYLLKGQGASGGWSQYFPVTQGYMAQITFNDNAIANIVGFLKDLAAGKGDFGFVDSTRRLAATKAVDRALELILKLQITANGVKTAWCAQYDQNTLKPATGRSYELPSISGSESVYIVRFLMSLEDPSPEICQAIQAAVIWFKEVEIKGKKLVTISGPDLEYGGDRVLQDDSSAKDLWARFYEIGTNRPIFASRDGIKKYDLKDISSERRTRYSWYGNYARSLLAAYPAWQEKFLKR